MALRVLSVTDIFSDEAHIDHCGLLIISERVDKLDRELPIIILPRTRERDNRADQGDSSAEEEAEDDDRLLYWSRSVARLEFYTDQEFGVICFYFNVEQDSSTRNRVHISNPDLSGPVCLYSETRLRTKIILKCDGCVG